MLLSTQTKLTILRTIGRLVHYVRALFGRREQVVQCRRGGLLWELDLNEGIDLTIYVLGKFEPATDRALARFLKEGDTALVLALILGRTHCVWPLW